VLVYIQENEPNAPFAINDRIFLGEGLFETLRVIKNKPRYPEYHWRRLQAAALTLNIPFELSFEIWLEKLNECIALKKLYEGGIKAILSAGSSSRGLLERGQTPHMVFDAFQYVPHSKFLNLISAPWQRDAKNPIYQIKAISYLEAIIARRYAQAAGADDVLFFNLQQHATDTTIANLFIIKNNTLITPPLHSGVLPGIIRQRLLELCKVQKIPCFELEISKNDLNQADAALVCNSLQGICPLHSLDGNLFSLNHPLISELQILLEKDQ